MEADEFLFDQLKIHLLVKQDRFSQTCQHLWYMDWDYFSNHLWEADLRGERLSLDEQVECKLVELLYRLEQKKHKEMIIKSSVKKLHVIQWLRSHMSHEHVTQGNIL